MKKVKPIKTKKPSKNSRAITRSLLFASILFVSGSALNTIKLPNMVDFGLNSFEILL